MPGWGRCPGNHRPAPAQWGGGCQHEQISMFEFFRACMCICVCGVVYVRGDRFKREDRLRLISVFPLSSNLSLSLSLSSLSAYLCIYIYPSLSSLSLSPQGSSGVSIGQCVPTCLLHTSERAHARAISVECVPCFSQMIVIAE